ncbi:hypothetical protein BP6252_04949 [Coleophoma cylindrospora]|uniref:Uncharacterized protein n=1 Tax=Coleophoma cylindrospora TaxID=1849047 RepID=A0A3D8S2I3_9HELO|nr:hypothetical protein BP6252_04949 [Coleophoma cylindrospora]
MTNRNGDEYDVLIVGAGWYGLIAAYTYLKLAPETNLLIVDDGETIGGVWSTERIYPDLFAQVGHGLFEYSFYPMKKTGLSPDRYISAQTIHDYLQSFAEDHDLVRRIRLQQRVTKAEKIRNKWVLTLNDGASQVSGAKLIAATGVTSGPYMPDFPQKGFNKPIVHSSELGKHISHLTGPKVQRVTVLGAAKSAYDTVFMLIKAGKQVDWIIRENGSGPLAIMPPRLMGVLNTVDVMATRAMASFSPAIMNTSGICIFWANAGLGLASAPEFWKTIHSAGLTVHRTEIDRFSEDDKVILKNNQALKTDGVVLCTGWTDNLSLFDESTRVTYGLPSAADLDQEWKDLDALADMVVLEKLPILKHSPNTMNAASTMKPWRLYRRMISPIMAAKGDRSVLFPGQIHSVFTPLVAELQALWGVAFMLGKLPLPDQEDMVKEVAISCAWTRRRYLEQGRKHAYYMYDYLSYIDTLARDLGLNTNRKSNMITEMFTPYRPSDWRGLISEYLAVEKKRQVNGNGKHMKGVKY